jgi:hypothetical protein
MYQPTSCKTLVQAQLLEFFVLKSNLSPDSDALSLRAHINYRFAAALSTMPRGYIGLSGSYDATMHSDCSA